MLQNLKVLAEVGSGLEEVSEEWPVIGQFSSIGSLGPGSQSWLTSEWLHSLATHGKRAAAFPHKFPSLQLVSKKITLSFLGYTAIP